MSGHVVRCDNCKGKGHVLEWGAVILCPFPFALLALLERNDPRGETREKCRVCDGKGYRRLPWDLIA